MIYANDNFGRWRSDFPSLVMAGLATDICIQLTAAETDEKKAMALAYMRDILKCDTRPWPRLGWHGA